MAFKRLQESESTKQLLSFYKAVRAAAHHQWTNESLYSTLLCDSCSSLYKLMCMGCLAVYYLTLTTTIIREIVPREKERSLNLASTRKNWEMKKENNLLYFKENLTTPCRVALKPSNGGNFYFYLYRFIIAVSNSRQVVANSLYNSILILHLVSYPRDSLLKQIMWKLYPQGISPYYLKTILIINNDLRSISKLIINTFQ